MTPAGDAVTPARVGRLERRIRWSLGLAAAAAALAGLALAGVVGGPGEGRLVVRELVLVDSAGQRRATLRVSEGGAELAMGREGGGRLTLAAGAESGAGVYLAGASGGTRLQLTLQHGDPAVSLVDGRGRVRWIAALSDRGTAVTRWVDTAGTDRIGIGSDGTGHSLQLYDAEGRNRATLAVDEEGAAFGIFGPEGRLLFP